MNSSEFFIIIVITFIIGCFSGVLIKDIAIWLQKNYRKYLFRPKILKPLTAQNRLDSTRELLKDQQYENHETQ